MLFWFSTIILGCSILYLGFSGILLHGLNRLRKQQQQALEKPSQWPTVSILICARNEAQNLDACLSQVMAQDYPGSWEVWVADDRSTDQTPQLLQSWQQRYPEHLQIHTITQIPPPWTAKKYALDQLVQKARGEICLLTDADCVVSPQWARTMISAMQGSVHWVSGFSHLKVSGREGSLLEGVQNLDFMSHRVVDAALVALGKPVTACGQNLAWRKSCYKKVQGFAGVEHVQGGDDDLLMHQFIRQWPGCVHYHMDSRSFVTSEGKKHWAEAWEQRKRWAGKTIHYDRSSVMGLTLVFLYFVTLLVAPLGMILYGFITADWLPLGLILLALIGKILGESLVMIRGLKLFHQSQNMKFLLPCEFLHIPVIVGAVIFGLMGRFQWKA